MVQSRPPFTQAVIEWEHPPCFCGALVIRYPCEGCAGTGQQPDGPDGLCEHCLGDSTHTACANGDNCDWGMGKEG